MGRPTQNPKIHRFEVRLSDNEKNTLEECERITGKKKSDIVIDGITMFYKKLNGES